MLMYCSALWTAWRENCLAWLLLALHVPYSPSAQPSTVNALVLLGVTQARARWVAVTGLSHAHIREDANFIRRYCASAPFLFLVNNFEANVDASFKIPGNALTEVGLPYEI
jgi:hypothetical protein